VPIALDNNRVTPIMSVMVLVASAQPYHETQSHRDN
jgi:hypothetical protein